MITITKRNAPTYHEVTLLPQFMLTKLQMEVKL